MSDGMTQAARSQRISDGARKLRDMQRNFLVNPTAERLNRVYDACSELAAINPGFYHETGKGLAYEVSQYLQGRFGDGEFTVEAKDLAFHLRNVHPNDREQELALIGMTSMNTTEVFVTAAEVIERIRSGLNEDNYRQLRGDIDGDQLEEMLGHPQLRELYPMLNKSQ